jgi:hypothetical protein
MNDTVILGYAQTVNLLANCFNVLLNFCITLKFCLNYFVVPVIEV